MILAVIILVAIALVLWLCAVIDAAPPHPKGDAERAREAFRAWRREHRQKAGMP